jgi:chromosomal replication initiator protein
MLTHWQKAQDFLREQLGATIVDTWIAPLQPREHSGNGFCLLAPDAFFQDWVEKHYRQAIEGALCRALATENIALTIEPAPQAAALPGAGSRQQPPPPDKPPAAQLNPRYTFENFVPGPSNRHAHAYCLAVATAPAKAYNPLFVYGGVGLGKTHLIQAACHQIRSRAANNLKICYITSEKFTNELIDAIQHKSTPAFRQKYRNADVLVIDDIHFIAGKESTQEEFFHTFNALYDAHKQIIFSSDRPPKEIANLQERLVSRFGWGLTTDVQPPDLETRVAILKKKIEREPVAVPDEAIFFIAQLIKTNVRELEGALIRTIAYALMEEKPITVELAQEVLKDLLKEPKKLITIDFIQRCVAEEFGVEPQALKTHRRNKNIVIPRQAAMYLSRELTELSLLEIGGAFGGKDHTTVLHSYNKIKEGMASNPQLKNKIEKVIQVIKQ